MRAPSNVIPLQPHAVVYLCERMRQDEQEQLHAFFDMEAQDWPGYFLSKRGPRYLLVDAAGMPLAAGGWESVAEGVMQGWMLGTQDAWATHWRSITRASRWLMGEVLARGIRRLQISALASREGACEWYCRSLGMQPEGVWRRHGRQGQDIAHFARVEG